MTAVPSTSSSSSWSDSSSSKSVYFIRHAESAYNAHKLRAVNWLTLAALRDPMIFDPPLSPRGLQQLIGLSEVVQRWGLRSKAELLVSSPLRRALDTAMAVQGEQFNIALTADGAAATAQPLPLPVLVSALCSEVVDTSADIGSSPSQLSSRYPQLSFSHLPDVWWYCRDEQRPRDIHDEPPARVEQRVAAFLEELWQRPERCLIVVSHSSFIRRCTRQRLKIANCCVQECRMERSHTGSSGGQLRVTVVREALE
jgi:broad specificity phosphatase PhoE